jgi:DNA replication terminus site-binding protein
MYSHLIIELGELIQQLHNTITAWSETLRASTLHHARVFQLPVISQEQTHQPYPRLPVTQINGEAAFDLALQAYRNFHAEPDASTKSVFRLPGALIVTPGDSHLFAEQFQQIDAIKSRISDVAGCIYPGLPVMRHKVIHQAFPRLVMLQLTRNIKLSDQALFSCRFTWVRKSSIKCLSTREAADMVGRMKSITPQEISQEVPWEDKVASEQHNILTLPARTGLRLRRPVKPHPMINLIHMEMKETPKGERRIQKMVDANLPILIINSPGVRLGTLRDFNPDKAMASRGRTLTSRHPVTQMTPIYPLKQDPSED